VALLNCNAQVAKVAARANAEMTAALGKIYMLLDSNLTDAQCRALANPQCVTAWLHSEQLGIGSFHLADTTRSSRSRSVTLTKAERIGFDRAPYTVLRSTGVPDSSP